MFRMGSRHNYSGTSLFASPAILPRDKKRRADHVDADTNRRFWKRAGYVPLYIRQTQSELTGEHSCVMVRGLNSAGEGDLQWLGEFAKGTNSFRCSELRVRYVC